MNELSFWLPFFRRQLASCSLFHNSAETLIIIYILTTVNLGQISLSIYQLTNCQFSLQLLIGSVSGTWHLSASSTCFTNCHLVGKLPLAISLVSSTKSYVFTDRQHLPAFLKVEKYVIYLHRPEMTLVITYRNKIGAFCHHILSNIFERGVTFFTKQHQRHFRYDLWYGMVVLPKSRDFSLFSCQYFTLECKSPDLSCII